MATVTPLLWKHKTDARGHQPLYLRVADRSRTLYVSLGVRLHPRHWNADARRVRKGHDHADRINGLVQRRLSEAEDERLRLLTNREPVTAAAIKAVLSPEKTPAEPCFLDYAERRLKDLERQGRIGRVRTERSALAKLKAFAGSPLPFSRVTTPLLRDHETHMLTALKNKPVTVRSNMAVVRSHFRRAMRDGLVPREADPFFAYAPVREGESEKHRLSEAEIAKIEGLDLGPGGPGGSPLSLVRDAFLFALYAAGVRFGDLANLRVEHLAVADVAVAGEGGVAEGVPALRLAYSAGKTGKRTAALLPPPAVRIVRPYLVDERGEPKKPGALLFPILNGYDLSTPLGAHRAKQSRAVRYNRLLVKLAAAAGIETHVSFHVARHSFADLARRRGWSVYDISKALRHSNLGTTERYLAGFDEDALGGGLGALFPGPNE